MIFSYFYKDNQLLKFYRLVDKTTTERGARMGILSQSTTTQFYFERTIRVRCKL